MTTLSAEIRRLLTDRGMTQYRLAARMDENHANISRWVNGVRTPNLRHLARIAAALDLDNDEIARVVKAAAATTEDRG